MEVDKRLLYKESEDATIREGKLTTPNPGVAYVLETDSVYFNNVVLPKGE